MESPNAIPSVPPGDKPSRIFRALKRVFFFLFLSIALLAGTIFLIGYYYQDEVKEYIITEINKQLNTEIIVDGKDIHFTVIQNFPYASLDFKNVKALDAIQSKKKDTLFKAEKISFQFNVKDIFNKNYRIKKLEIDRVELKIRVDKNGNDNYHFWKTTTDTSNTAFSFALENIALSQVHVVYKNLQSKQNIDALIKTSDLSGAFSNERYLLEASADLFINSIKVDDSFFLRKKNVAVQSDLNVDTKTNSYKIKDTRIKIEDLLFEIVGNIVNQNNTPVLNLGIHGKNMDIRSVLSMIPEKYKSKINDYESEGEFYFSSTIQGAWSGKEIPQIQADFGIKNADITQVKDDIILHHVNLKGHYSNGKGTKLSSLTLNPFSATIDDGSIAGGLTLINLDNPSFNGKINANIRLEKLQRFIKIDTIETISGQLEIDAIYSGESKNEGSGHYHTVTTSGHLGIADMNMKLKNNILDFLEINGDFSFDNNDLSINHLTGNISNSDFDLKGSFKNLMGFILRENENLFIDASLRSKHIDLNEILANKEEGAPAGSKYKLRFSEHIDVNLNSEIQHLEFRKFNAKDIRGVIHLQDKKMVLDPISISTMNGNITASGLVDGSDSTKLLVTCYSDVSRINITKMFEQFENFGQVAITDKNIKGITTCKIQFASVLTPELEMDLDKLYAGIDMTVENGELNNVESMKSLSKFIELKELENVRFATLKNQIEIKNRQISIPKMEVKSNAINIIASGTHSFNNEINYKVKLSLNELLAKKAKKAKKQNEEFGVVADDGLGRTNIFLSMTGTVDDPIIRYDSKSAMQNVKEDLKVEKQTLKTILKEEFGLFKKDSSLNNKAPKENVQFRVKWYEDEQPQKKTELKKPKKEEDEDF